jgi:UDP-N-acetylmuramoyl-tripeptide--D-alanyl-D-alanine ligase
MADVAEKLARFEPPRMRQEVLVSDRGFSVMDDSYNASPASVAAALDVLSGIEVEGRRVAVLGEVGELGDSARELHAMMGAYAAACPLDLVVFVGGENADEMARAASIMGMSEDIVVRAPTAEAAAELVGPVLAPGDLVLAKGSRSVGLDRFVKAVL